ncbi:MAG TPA: hypothetical protein VGB76_03350 [Pyrinomonadaceae bacterium]|jgi:hypothetical protein
MKRYGLRLVILVALAAQASGVGMPFAGAQQNWEKAPFQNWGAADVKAVLEKSPWSRVIEQNTVIAPSLLGVNAPKMEEKTIILLRSALPVRQALLRERQLASKYESMNAADRAAFDAKNKALLDCPACARYYVISIKCNYACYGGSFVEDHKKSFYLLNDKGERRELAGATPLPDKQEGALFFFPRLNDKGEPLLTPASKELTFHSLIRPVVNADSLSQKYRFDVTKMVRGGEVVF